MNTERNWNGWISRLQDGFELVSSENGAGPLLPLQLFLPPLSPPSLLLSVIFIQSFLPNILPLSFTLSYLWCVNGPGWLPCPQLSMSIGTYNWLGTYLWISYSNSWDKKTLVDPDHPLNQGPQTISLGSQWLTLLGSGVHPGSINCDTKD